jgi:hypothetical protein
VREHQRLEARSAVRIQLGLSFNVQPHWALQHACPAQMPSRGIVAHPLAAALAESVSRYLSDTALTPDLFHVFRAHSRNPSPDVLEQHSAPARQQHENSTTC